MSSNSKLINILIVLIFVLFISAISYESFSQSGEIKTYHSGSSQVIAIGAKSSGLITSKEIIQTKQLSLIPPYDSIYHIVSFRMTRVRKGKTPIEIKNDLNGELNDKMIELTGTLIPGDKVYFEYIKCRSTDGTTRSMGALSFIIQ